MDDILNNKNGVTKTSFQISIESLYHNKFKRIMDIVLSVIGIVFSFPILFIAILCIMIESKGGWLYKQKRVGIGGSIFTIFKLRTMYINTGEGWTEQNDSRITRIGRLIRKTRIDELPQLVNVIKGEMSLIGPRPERPVYEKVITEQLPDFKKRLMVKPGITGWAQVNGGYNISNEEKLKLDLYYIKNMSIWMDAKILLMTLAVILTANGAR